MSLLCLLALLSVPARLTTCIKDLSHAVPYKNSALGKDLELLCTFKTTLSNLTSYSLTSPEANNILFMQITYLYFHSIKHFSLDLINKGLAHLLISYHTHSALQHYLL